MTLKPQFLIVSSLKMSVYFLTDIASLLASKARLKLNTKKLYASDGRAVQELLKLATLLFRCALPHILRCYVLISSF
jgi:hypothetical protein